MKTIELLEESPQDIKINRLDTDAFLLLSNLPDGEDYWNSFSFRKVKR